MVGWCLVKEEERSLVTQELASQKSKSLQETMLQWHLVTMAFLQSARKQKLEFFGGLCHSCAFVRCSHAEPHIHASVLSSALALTHIGSDVRYDS